MEDGAPTGLPPRKKRSLDVEDRHGGGSPKKSLSEAEAWQAKQEEEIRKAIEAEELWDADLRYHLFQGHRQATGGSQVAQLYEKFKALSISCWRDLVQWVKDERAMIRGVAESSIYTLYLTRDAITKFVTLEARAAKILGKPVIIFLEDDARKPSYAGGSVEKATEGWPEDLKTYFSTGHYMAWGGQPFQWDVLKEDAALRGLLQYCSGKGVPVPKGSSEWNDALKLAEQLSADWSSEIAELSHRDTKSIPGAASPPAALSVPSVGGRRKGGGGGAKGEPAKGDRAKISAVVFPDGAAGAKFDLKPSSQAAANFAAFPADADIQEHRFLVVTDPRSMPTKGIAAEHLRKLDSIRSVCIKATPPSKSASQANASMRSEARQKSLVSAREEIGGNAHPLDAQDAKSCTSTPTAEDGMLRCGERVLVPQESTGGLVYGLVISNEKEETPKDWSAEEMQLWLSMQGLASSGINAFDGMDGENFLDFFTEPASRHEMETKLSGIPQLAQAPGATRLKTWENILKKLLTPAEPLPGWMRCPSPAQRELGQSYNSPGKKAGFVV